MKETKTAIIHDYFFQNGGAEKVVEAWLEKYPRATIYTSIFYPEKFQNSPTLQKAFQEKRIKTSFLQGFFRLLGLHKYHKHFFWLYPLAMSLIQVRGYDQVLISATYCGKNPRIQGNPKILFYCHTPTRFLHGLITEADQQSLSKVYQLIIPLFTWWLRILDLRAVEYLKAKKTKFVANSKYIQDLINKVYQTSSQVVYPPVEIQHFFDLQKTQPQEPYYYFWSRISFHKRVDLIVRACIELQRKLYISGVSGLESEMQKLYEIRDEYPEGRKWVQFLGRSSDTDRDRKIAGAKAFLFPPKEDFGIVSIEAMATGTPIIAFGAGGALEYVKPNINGVLFHLQEVESLKQAILDFESKNWDPKLIKSTVKHFSKETHQTQIQKILES